MKFDLDSSVAFKWVVPESDTPKAVRLRDEYRAAVHSSPFFIDLASLP